MEASVYWCKVDQNICPDVLEVIKLAKTVKKKAPESGLYLKFNNLAVPGSTSIIISISFFSGIILFTLGIMGIYLARIFEQTKGREQYVIKEIKDYK